MDGLERFARDFKAGTVLFEEGQPGDFMYVVATGDVEIRRKVGETERVLAVIQPGDFFGEMAILNSRPRTCSISWSPSRRAAWSSCSAPSRAESRCARSSRSA